jgi:hypothetical protein
VQQLLVAQPLEERRSLCRRYRRRSHLFKGELGR